MFFKQGRYSGFLKPISYLVDLSIIYVLSVLLPLNIINPILFYSYLTILWIIISIKNNFYDVERYAKLTLVLSLLFRQFILHFLILYAFIGFFKEFKVSRLLLAEFFLLTFLLVSFFKILMYYLLKRYRKILGGNHRNTVVIGDNKKSRQLVEIFNDRLEYGYNFKRIFPLDDNYFNLRACFEYIENNNIDEIYCSVSELSDEQMNSIIDFADNNLKVVKFLPDNKNIFTKKLKFEYYDYLPILSLRDIPLDETINSFLKRLFDIAFSLFVILFILSWLTPILAVLIRLDSKGPIFFRQVRNGFNSEEFSCYKFRSMTINRNANKEQAVQGDARVTKMGRFIRKTSIDELPQFFNVFIGQMSIVGPRPHMVAHTEEYSKNVDKYMVRHFVKPGITGLAQVMGYRGGIEEKSDIINRVKLDIFYAENWSLALDLKIIAKTILNAVKGEANAY